MSVAYDLEYLQATGTQYIDTGYVPNQNTRIVLDAHIVPTTTNDPVFGARTATTNNVFALWTSSTAVNPQYGNVAYNTQTISMDCNQRLIYELNKNVFTVNGTTKTFAEATFDSTYPMYLFQINNGGSIYNRYTKGKIYSCKIYDNDVLVRDFVPKLIDGVAGLYDNISSDFYTNAGTGNFGYTLTTLCEDCGFNNFFAARRRMLMNMNSQWADEPLIIFELSGMVFGQVTMNGAYYTVGAGPYLQQMNTFSGLTGYYSLGHTGSIYLEDVTKYRTLTVVGKWERIPAEGTASIGLLQKDANDVFDDDTFAVGKNVAPSSSQRTYTFDVTNLKGIQKFYMECNYVFSDDGHSTFRITKMMLE